MPGGRPPKPTEQKRRLGNPGKRALPARQTFQPGAVATAPALPPGLRKHGKNAWQRYWMVGSPWLNATTDVAIVTRLCQAYDEREELRDLVKRLGHVVAEFVRDDDLDALDGVADDAVDEPVGQDEQAAGVVQFPSGKRVDEKLEGQPHGGALRRRKRRPVQRVYTIKANPAVQQLRKLEELITRYEGLCGFTPSDRSRLGLAEVKTVSALDRLMARQQDRRAARSDRTAASPGDDGDVVEVDPL